MTTLDHDRPILARAHSAEFVRRWSHVVATHFRWEEDFPFCHVPKLLGGSVRSCVPLLNHSHLTLADAERYMAASHRSACYIRVLGEPVDDSGSQVFGSPVTMRVDLSGACGDPDSVFENALRSVTRRRVRAALKSGVRVESTTEAGAVSAFHTCLLATSRRLGFPCPAGELFESLLRDAPGRLYTCYSASGSLIGGALVFIDGNIRWQAWNARDAKEDVPGAGELLAWTMLSDACRAGAEVFDFGRSAYGGGTFLFKQKFGARPVSILLLTDAASDVYGKYRMAQELWRRAPSFVTDRVGPVLCRYLADY